MEGTEAETGETNRGALAARVEVDIGCKELGGMQEML